MQRNADQLKKLWSNLKTKQRNALTTENCRLATGGGPSIPDSEVDPNIALIAPNLIKTAPILFSSNMSEEEVTGTFSSFFPSVIILFLKLLRYLLF